MAVTLVGVLANAGLNYCLIHGVKPFPELGFAGSAWGTVIASWLQAILLIGCFFTRLDFHAYGLGCFRLSWNRMKRLLRVGVPAGVQGFLDLLSWGVLLAWLISHFDYKHLAAQTILTACIRFSFVPADGIASGLATLVGHAQGERNFLLAKRHTLWAFRLIATYMTFMAIVYYAARYPIMRLFTDDPEVIEIGASCMLFVAAFQYFDAMNVTHINALQGAGDTAWPTAMQLLLSSSILLGGGSYMVHHHPELQSSGVWLVAAIYVCAQGIVFRIRWIRGRWRRIRLLD